MAEWIARVESLIPQGQMAEVLVVARVDRITGATEIMVPTMMELGPSGDFPLPDTGNPFGCFGFGSVVERGPIDQLLQCLMDCAWQRGLRPKKFDPSADALAAVKAHLEDMRRLARAEAPTAVQDAAQTERGFGDAGS